MQQRIRKRRGLTCGLPKGGGDRNLQSAIWSIGVVAVQRRHYTLCERTALDNRKLVDAGDGIDVSETGTKWRRTTAFSSVPAASRTIAIKGRKAFCLDMATGMGW
jgi:hypothetical protein